MTDQNDKNETEQTETAVTNQPTTTESTETRIEEQPSPVRPDPSFERRAVRRGCFSVIFGAVLGALVGGALTLSLLSWLNNGTLTYNQTSVQLHNELADEIATRQAALDEQTALMNDLLTRQAESEATMMFTVNEAEASKGTMEAEVAKMQVTAVYLETRIGQAGNAADTIESFLDGLDDLISDVATPQPNATPTP